MSSSKRGDVILVAVPGDPNDKSGTPKTTLRPAVVLHPAGMGDAAVSVMPLVPVSHAPEGAIAIQRGSYEAARMGLVTDAALAMHTTFDVPKQLAVKTIGRCPYELLDEALRRRRSLLASASRDNPHPGAVETAGARPGLDVADTSDGGVGQPEVSSSVAMTDVAVVTNSETAAELAEPEVVALQDANFAAQPADETVENVTGAEPVYAEKASPPSVAHLYDDRFPVERARYTCLRTPSPLTIDGDLTKPEWQAAPVSNAFVDIVTGKPAWFDTRVRLLWDDHYLYFGFTAEETDVWGTLMERDSKIYEENDLELFIGGENAYYEFEISARNVIYEVFWIWKDVHKPGGPYWIDSEFDTNTQRTMVLDGVGGHHHPRGERWGFLDWDCPGLKTAVRVDGTLNKRDDVDKGWSAEIAIPWQSLVLLADGRSLPPKDGDVWRIDCSRFEKVGKNGEDLDPCVGWTWNQHGHYDSHIPEVFPYVTFRIEEVKLPGTEKPTAVSGGE